MICGLVNGLLIAKLKLPDFIVTLGTLSVFRGVALIYTNGQPIYGLPEGFRAAFGGQLLGVPTPVIMAIVVAGLAFFLVRFTALGEQIVAVGGNEEAARLSGINIDRVKIVVYTLSGLLSSGRICPHRPDRRRRADWRKRLRVAGDRRAVIGGASLFGGWKSTRLSDRRANAWRFAKRTDAHERPFVLAICGLRRGRHPSGLR